MADNGDHQGGDAPTEHLNIKVTDNNNEVFFKIKRSTKLEKLMTAFCERQGKSITSVRFLFDGTRVQPTDTPDTVRPALFFFFSQRVVANMGLLTKDLRSQLDMADGDSLEVHQEQVGGAF